MTLLRIKADNALGVAMDASTVLPGIWISVMDAQGEWHPICYSPNRQIADADFLYVLEIVKIRGPFPVVRSSEPEPFEASR